ncbi:LacI family DNA-binding transcriptional regulator [Allostreptomyces psammosilenae]|uniref:DNA-binding LacI/PurR family transcriptional regulator n=1 Tax=Allostreptomyces psammosilenae TaxID=1892865 RepID=A0A853A013_9ACTN|nr:LacI family DNA-binding transcriptional regulator [Allostreptomyces psammosilenae]NYI07705.1 DNA-binding LacI/PurR family transcriptional regulator [Allostreptomyces psammosilenae]
MSEASGAVPRERGKPVMRDVARLVGVSHQTVSRVLNNHPSVRRETRERVLAAIRELDYHRNSAARALVTDRSHILGVVTLDLNLVGPASTVSAIERVAREAGYFVSVASASATDEDSMVDAIGRLREQGVEGIVTVAPVDSLLAALARVPEEMPLVGTGIGHAPGVPMVGVDNYGGAVAATRHLLDLGHATVHHICGPTDWPETRERLKGWRATLTEAGAEVPPVLAGDWSARSGYEAARLIARDPQVTAVFCGNDQMAVGALRALHQAGRAVPGEVSVVGFDGIPEAAYLQPPLTTVAQDFGALGRASLELLINQIATGERPSQHVLHPPRLVVRESTGPVAG